jgi:hypothetical protein
MAQCLQEWTVPRLSAETLAGCAELQNFALKSQRPNENFDGRRRYKTVECLLDATQTGERWTVVGWNPGKKKTKDITLQKFEAGFRVASTFLFSFVTVKWRTWA